MNEALVISVSRKYLKILTQDKQILKGVLASKDLSALVGDIASYTLENDEAIIHKIAERKNILKRAIANKSKELATNVDLVALITAPAPLFNRNFIDRVLATSISQDIKVIIVINKNDLNKDLEKIDLEIKKYSDLGIKVVFTNTIYDNGLEQLELEFKQINSGIICLLGVSGVGKSSIINKLCPQQELRIGSTSEKSGQGKQTTTVSHAYLDPKNSNRILVDLPGIQNFGTSHLSKEELLLGFPEIYKYCADCKFNNCKHINEPKCGVKKAVEQCLIDSLRFQSYKTMLEEIEKVTSY